MKAIIAAVIMMAVGVVAFAGVISDSVKKGANPDNAVEYLYGVRTNSFAFYVSAPTNSVADRYLPSGSFPMGATLRSITGRTMAGTVKCAVATNLWSSGLTDYGIIQDGFTCSSALSSNRALSTVLSKGTKVIVLTTNVAAGSTGLWVVVEFTVP